LFKNNSLYVIVPHRGVAAGKTRLSAVLDDTSRSELNRWLLLRTLRVLGAWLGDTRCCVVVSPCSSTLTLARHTGATTLTEQPLSPGLNAALTQGAEHAAALGAQRLLILPCDLPRLGVAALRAMAATADAGADVVIAPDHHGTGTNALLVPAAAREFAFGEGSLARHLAMAQACRLRALAFKHPALAYDLDTAQDFSAWQRSGAALPPFVAARQVVA
jgi:2-phospho-L-lactate/phosphoenolpyruvate guanylyltransferase